MALSERPSNGMRDGLPCSLCECLYFSDYQPMSTKSDFHSRLFHHPCKDCEQNVDWSDCCTFCQHLRIRHLLFCLSKWGSGVRDYENLKYFKVKLGRIAELQSRQPCPLCQFFYDVMTLRYRFWQERIPGECKPIFLEFTCLGPRLRVLDGENIPFSFLDIGQHYRTPKIPLSTIDWNPLREYMAEKLLSRSNNLSTQHTSAPLLHQNFLVIDVDSGCIVSKPRSCTYAALSYMWGNPKQGELQACLANIRDFEKPGALRQGGVPLTVLDAMTAASELKIPYLWVDRFCIVQDDPQTKHNLINQMDSIYASAIATFVAGAGKDPSYGLPGVSNELLPRKTELRIHGMTFTEVLPGILKNIMSRMEWNKRGWTYQEAMFSENLIFFTDFGVFYERTKRFLDILEWSPDQFHRPVPSKMSDFFRSIEAYSGRTLSYETDIERAFLGVLRSYFGEEHAYGLPLRSFHNALLWKPTERWWKPRQSANDDIFPSWSWLSVVGRVEFSEASSSDPEHPLPVATWAMNFRTASGKSELCFISFESDNCFISDGWFRVEKQSDDYFARGASLFHIAWNEGFFEGERPPHPFSDYISNKGPRWSLWLQRRTLKSISAPPQSDFPLEYLPCLRPGHAIVRTQYVGLPEFLSSNDEGEGLFDDDEMQQLCEGLGETENVGMIALSIKGGYCVISSAQTYDDVNIEGYDVDIRGYEWSIDVNVMLIRCAADGVAYRTGIGSVSLEAWKKARPSLETMVLG